MTSVRLRRLQADYEKLLAFVKSHPRLQLVQAEGDPPERYQLEYRINSLRQINDELSEVKSHLVEISLPRNYPRIPPLCRMLTPIFHPNIAPHAICIGDHWSAGEPLAAIVARIGELIAYQSYNTKSPLNGEAARWTDQNLHRLPLDPVSMVPEDPGMSSAATMSATAVPPQLPIQGSNGEPEAATRSEIPVPVLPIAAPHASDNLVESAPAPDPFQTVSEPAASIPAETIRFRCDGCGAMLRALTKKAGMRIRCPRCSADSLVPLE